MHVSKWNGFMIEQGRKSGGHDVKSLWCCIPLPNLNRYHRPSGVRFFFQSKDLLIYD